MRTGRNQDIVSRVEESYQEFLSRIGEEEFTEPYRKVCQSIRRELEQINEKYSRKLGRTFISQITYRIKTPESCLKKLLKKNQVVEWEKAPQLLGDIAGVRVVCSFLDDMYKLAEIISKSGTLEVVKVKDYVRNPKESGYQSLHIIVLVPVEGTGEAAPVQEPGSVSGPVRETGKSLTSPKEAMPAPEPGSVGESASEAAGVPGALHDGASETGKESANQAGKAPVRKKAEIQIRTQAMNFWASVEHHFVYKNDAGQFGEDYGNRFRKDLKECARTIYSIDKKMLRIRKKMEKAQKSIRQGQTKWTKISG